VIKEEPKKEEVAAAPSHSENEPKKEEKSAPKAAPKEGAPKGARKEGGKDQKSAPKETKPPKAATKQAPEVVDISRLDIRVGKIVEAKRHPEADRLYVEQIDLGEGSPRQIVSGLVNFVPIDEMQNRFCLVVCNLKPNSLKNVISNGMVLCASNADHTQVEFIDPPPGVNPGEPVTFHGYPRNPDPVLNPKKKIFETIKPDLSTNDELVATYKGIPFMTSQGICKSKSIKGEIS